MVKKSTIVTTSIWEYARMGFGLGLGSFAALMVYMFIGMMFFIPGFILVNKEKAKGDKQNQSLKILGYVLMVIGVIIGVGLGAGTFFSELGDEF